MNTLYYGDNLRVLREHIADESIDLIYLDPPSGKNLLKSPKGRESETQIEGFEDTWHWNKQAKREFDELLHQPNTRVAAMMRALRAFLGENDMMAYLTMMANRLLELHRVLKPTGSIYLHCGPATSHYLKIIVDAVFGKEMFRNEIIWRRSNPLAQGHSSEILRLVFDQEAIGEDYEKVHETILVFSKTENRTWNPQFQRLDPGYVDKFYRHVDEDGRRFITSDLTSPGEGLARRFGDRGIISPPQGRHWTRDQEEIDILLKEKRICWTKDAKPLLKMFLDEHRGLPLQDLWTDIPPLWADDEERPVDWVAGTLRAQKPLALLERIIAVSSNAGDVVLDPFSGCGTTVDAAQKLKRNWIGIDITHLAISLIEKRLKDRYGVHCKFDLHGIPISKRREPKRRIKPGELI